LFGEPGTGHTRPPSRQRTLPRINGVCPSPRDHYLFPPWAVYSLVIFGFFGFVLPLLVFSFNRKPVLIFVGSLLPSGQTKNPFLTQSVRRRPAPRNFGTPNFLSFVPYIVQMPATSWDETLLPCRPLETLIPFPKAGGPNLSQLTYCAHFALRHVPPGFRSHLS